MKKAFKNFLKTLGLLFLVFVLALGTMHFHTSDLTIHHDCLACSFINNAVVVSPLGLILVIFVFVAQRLIAETVSYSSPLFSFERLRAPPQ
jgi:hypothetical protein